MHAHPLQSTGIKIGVIIAIVLLVSGGVAYTFTQDKPKYTQILLDISPSDSTSQAAIAACAQQAVNSALARGGSTIDIALVSGSPAAMKWTTINARESFWTRLSF